MGRNPTIRIFGYGNPSRMDDGVGRHLAPLLADDLRNAGMEAELWLGHQLLPEASCEIEEGDILIFVDASLEEHPSGFRMERVEPDRLGNLGLNIHSFGPGWFLALLNDLGPTPSEAWMLSVSGESFDFGETITATCRNRADAGREAFRKRFIG